MKHILLIDDDIVFTTAVSQILHEQDYKVSIAKDGKEAAEELSSSTFSLIVTDMLMPYTNGLEMVSNIRQNAETLHTPIMVISGIDNEQSISDWSRLGVNSWVKKPLSMTTLITNIQNLTKNAHYVAS